MDTSRTISTATDGRFWQVFADHQKIQRQKKGQVKCYGEEASEREEKTHRASQILVDGKVSLRVRRKELLLSNSIHGLILSSREVG